MGRDRVLETAVSMLEQAELTDLLSFLGTRAVAEAADVQPATVHHHFGNRDSSGRPNTRLAAAVLDACLRLELAEQTAAEVRSVADTGTADAGSLTELRAAAQASLETFLAQRRLALGTFVGAAVAANDPVARDVLHEMYEAILGAYTPVYESVARQLGRRFDTEHGFSAEMMSVFGTALIDGLVVRNQFDPERVDTEAFAELMLRIFEAVTLPEDVEPTDGEVVVERLLQRRAPLDLPAGSQRYVHELERRLAADRSRGVPLARTVERHLHRVVDLCKSSPELADLLLDASIGNTRSADPLAAVLGPVLHQAASELRAGVADTPEAAEDLAATITYLTVVRTMSRPTETASEVVQRIMDMVLDGIVARREDGG